MPGNERAFQKAMDQGHSAAWDQNWPEAAKFYRQALAHDQENPNALSSLGLALYEMGEMDEALGIYQKLTRLSPNDPLPMEKVARIFERQGRLREAIQTGIHVAEMYLRGRDVEKAIENWIRITSMQADNLLVRNRLAAVYDRMGRKADAVSEYLAIASILQTQGELSKATQTVEYAVNLMPENKDAQQALQTIRAGLQLPKPMRARGATAPVRMAAVREMQQVALPEPSQAPSGKVQDPLSEARQKALEELAMLLFEQTDETSTAQTRRNLSALTKGTGALNPDYGDRARISLHVSQAIESQTQGNHAQAAEELERAVQLGLRTPAVYFDLGFLQAELNPQEALVNLQHALRNPDYTLAASLLMARVNCKQENYTEAANLSIQALRMADIFTSQPKQTDELNAQYESILESIAIEKDVQRLKEICAKVEEHVLRPDWRRYLSSARQQVDASSSSGLALAEMFLAAGSGKVVEALGVVRRLAQDNKLASAMEEAYFALQVAPTYLPLHLEIGELLLREGRTSEAVAKFTLIADLYALRGETAQANRLFRRILQAAPMDMTIRSRLADSLVAQGLVEEALEQTMELAQIYYQLADLDQARQTYSNALRLAQQSKTNRIWSVKILTRVADIDMQRLDLRQAVRVYEQIRSLEPEDTAVSMQLTDLYFRTGQDGQAVTEAEKAVGLLEKSGKHQEALDFLNQLLGEREQKFELRRLLAEVYIRMRDPRQALEQLDILANACLDAGDKTGALAALQRIISLNPPNVDDYRRAAQELSGS